MRVADKTGLRTLIVLCGLCSGAAAAATPTPGGQAYMKQSSPARVAAFAKLPDWRGFWEQFYIGASGTPDRAEVARDVGGPQPQFTDAWITKMKTENKHNAATQKLCTFGFPTLLESSPLIFEIVSIPEETLMVFNMREIRHIYTDGKGHTPEDIRLDTPWGDSVGTWNGATLLIETVGSYGMLVYNNNQGKRDSTTLSDQAKYHERLRMLNPDTLEDSVTVEDSTALKVPYAFTRHYHRDKGMIRVAEELDCEMSGTNDRNPVVNGQYTIAPPK